MNDLIGPSRYWILRLESRISAHVFRISSPEWPFSGVIHIHNIDNFIVCAGTDWSS